MMQPLEIKQDGLDEELERITLVDDAVIQLQEYATILRDNEPVKFDKLKERDDITVFGLEDCDGNNNGVDFYGFVLIVEDDDVMGDKGNYQDDDDDDKVKKEKKDKNKK